jgi:hypothetical protein
MKNFNSKIFFLIITALALFVGFYRPHTPNFGWGNVLSYEILADLSHADIFWNTRIPIFRPSLHLEKILVSGCGKLCVELYNSFIWAICFFVYLTTLLLLSCKVFSSKRRYAIALVFLMNVGVVVYSLFFSYGSYVDILYALAVSGLALIALSKNQKIRNSTFLTIAIISALVFIADNSRPYFLYVFPILVIISFVQKRREVTAALIVGAMFCVPYHVAQFINTGSATLSNYSGCNIAEVFKPPEENLIINYLPENVNSDEVSLYCHNRLQKIKSYVLESPQMALNDALEMPRLLWIIAPPPFVPDVSFSHSQPWRLMAWAILIVFLYLPVVASSLFFVTRAMTRGRVDEALVYIAIFLPMIFAILAHGGWESGRVQMAFFYPLALINIRSLISNNPIRDEA